MIRYKSPEVTLHHGDCLDVLATLPDGSVDAVVTDPPYGLEFMGKEWDGSDGFRRSLNLTDVDRDNPFGRASRTSPEYRAGSLFQQWCEAWAAECLRVLKPGGHLLAFGGTRTWHRLACAVEDAGFELRDSIAWMYGSGFPKSLDVSKAIDKAAGAERERSQRPAFGGTFSDDGGTTYGTIIDGAPITDAARTWQGWGTALKPAFEPVVVARKPLVGTVAGNVLAWGTGALNVDGCRVEHASADDLAASQAKNPGRIDTVSSGVYGAGRPQQSVNVSGRWPANVVLDEDQAAALDEQSGESVSVVRQPTNRDTRGVPNTDANVVMRVHDTTARGVDDLGGASRFFYVAKADASERPKVGGVMHPTVKPLSLMRWLVRLVTPPGGVVLEPFAGSGTTVEACLLEGFRCIAIEKSDEYLPLIEARIHRRRDPVAAHKLAGDDEDNLFDLLDDEQGANA